MPQKQGKLRDVPKPPPSGKAKADLLKAETAKLVEGFERDVHITAKDYITSVEEMSAPATIKVSKEVSGKKDPPGGGNTAIREVAALGKAGSRGRHNPSNRSCWRRTGSSALARNTSAGPGLRNPDFTSE
jgi:hypothetical protein